MDNKDLVLKVANEIMSVCDGAIEKDGIGYNKFDSPLVEDILSKPFKTSKEYETLRKTLLKYKKQIKEKDYKKLLSIKFNLPSSETSINIDTEEKKLILNTPYNKDFVTDIKELKNRYWSGSDWCIPLKDKEEAIKAINIVRKYFDYEFDKDIINDYFKNNDFVYGSVIITDIKESILKLKFEYNKDLVDLVKTFSQRSWNPDEKYWKIKLITKKDIEKLYSFIELLEIKAEKNNGVVKLDDKINIFKDKQKEIDKKIKASFKASSNFKIPKPDNGFNYKMFQKAGIEFIEKVTKGNVLLADEMGLGKTIQALGYLNLHPEYRPVLVICPNTMKYKWEEEIKTWILKNNETLVIDNIKNYDDLDYVDFIIINYDIIHKEKCFEFLNNGNFKSIIIDESHYIKNYKAKRTKAVIKLAKKDNVDSILALTGTPIINRPIEVYNILNLLSPSNFSNWRSYAYKFCDGHYNYIPGVGEVFDASGHSNEEEFGELLRSSVMIRRLKRDVLKELPDKIRTIINVNNTNKSIRKLENKIKESFVQLKKLNSKKIKDDKLKNLIKTQKTSVFGLIEEYRQKAAKTKLPHATEFINSLIDQDQKVIVFVYHREIHQALMNKFKDVAVGIIGGMPVRERQNAIDRFQNDEDIKVCINSIRAASEGITLTAASNVLFVEYDWTPGIMKQAEDRAHRIGQKYTVSSYWLALKDSIDFEFIEKIMNKLQVIESITNMKKIDEVNKFDLFDVVI